MMKYLKTFSTQSFLTGLGIAAAVYTIAPALAQTLKPLAVRGGEGAAALNNKAKQAIYTGREKIDNLIQKEPDALTQAVSELNELMRELKAEKQSSSNIMSEMNNTINSLKEELSNIKGSIANS